MTTRCLILVCTGALFGQALAQYEPDTLKPLPRVCDVFLLPGGQFERAYAVGLDQWRTLLPGSELLGDDLADHRQFNGWGLDLAGAGLFAASVSFRLDGPEHPRRSGAYLRAGFAFQHHGGNDLRLRKETRVPYDTLTSSQSGNAIYVDSLTISTYELEHAYDQLGLDFSVIFLKEYPKRWTLYGGAGVQAGFTFQGRAQVSHTIEHRTDPRFAGSGTPVSATTDTEFEEFRTKDDLCFAVYVPMGVTYRLAKRRAFWRALNLCYEMRPTIMFGGVPELNIGTRTVVAHHFGLRVDLVR